MLKSIDPTTTQAWKELQDHYSEMKVTRLTDLFESDEKRFDKYSLHHEELLVDFSKNFLTEKTLGLLIKLAKEVDLRDAIEQMFTGKRINETEDRAVLHTALRNKMQDGLENQELISDSVNAVLEKVRIFSEKIINGHWKGYSGKKIKNIVNIGIGGSSLGPAMVYNALAPFQVEDLKIHYVSNVDFADLASTLRNLNPETTLFIVSSKTFTTEETMTNAFSARKWFLESASEENIPKHFVAVSTNKEATLQFGIHEDNVFEFWDWVGGRYSVWSAIGLSVACGLGFQNFRNLLDGAASMDNHFRKSELESNIPVVLALISTWYVNMYNCNTEAVLAYNHNLGGLVDYLQQLVMESNGKSIDRTGKKVDYNTSPIIWGGSGTDCQHSFFQLLHQGTQMIPCDFIASINSSYSPGTHQSKLLANFLAQSRALMTGKSLEDVLVDMKGKGVSEEESNKVAPHRVFDGNRPSNTIVVSQLTPYNLGMLMAMYEHKVFVQGIIWNIYSFDQWGVELGKNIAKEIHTVMEGNSDHKFDSSTDALINQYKKISNV